MRFTQKALRSSFIRSQFQNRVSNTILVFETIVLLFFRLCWWTFRTHVLQPRWRLPFSKEDSLDFPLWFSSNLDTDKSEKTLLVYFFRHLSLPFSERWKLKGPYLTFSCCWTLRRCPSHHPCSTSFRLLACIIIIIFTRHMPAFGRQCLG